MGGGQSQERVVGVEEKFGDGEPQIIVTEDFVKHINAKQGVRGSQNEDSREEEEEEEGDQFIPSAEQLLIGDEYQRSSTEGAYSSSEEASRWRRKFELEQRKNQSLKTLNSEVFDNAVDEIRDKFASKASGDMMPVCEDCRDRVDECYQKNNSKPLLCSSVVREYVECVEKYRRGLMQAQSQQV